MFLFEIRFFVAKYKVLRTQIKLEMQDPDEIILSNHKMGPINVKANKSIKAITCDPVSFISILCA